MGRYPDGYLIPRPSSWGQADPAKAMMSSLPGLAWLPRQEEVPTVVTETARLRIRKLTLDDAGFVLALVNDPSFVANIGDKGLRSLDDARRFILKSPWTNQRKPGLGQFAVELKETSTPVGVCGLQFRERLSLTDIGFAFLPEHRGKGLAFEAAEAVLRYGRSTLGLERIVGRALKENSASIKLLERLGMKLETAPRRVDDDPGIAVYS